MTVPIWRILGQSMPGAAVLANAYTVAQGRQGTVETITCCNQAGAGDTIRIAVRIAGAAVGNQEFLYYDHSINANTTYVHHWPLAMFTGDELWVYSTNGTTSFNLFGREEFV